MSNITYLTSLEIPFELNSELLEISKKNNVTSNDLINKSIELFVGLDRLWNANHLVFFKNDDVKEPVAKTIIFDKDMNTPSINGLSISLQTPMSLHINFKKICMKKGLTFTSGYAFSINFLLKSLKNIEAGIPLCFCINSSECNELAILN